MTGAEVKRRAKKTWNGIRLAYVRRVHAYTPAEFRKSLEELGLRANDSVLMHARLSPFNGFTGQPVEILAAVQDVIGADGTLLMMSSAYRTATRRYLEASPTFDVRRTPSQMGMLTEILRRTPGARRSLHPAHPVLARGAKADWFVAGHEATPFSCGDQTPFSRLVEADGKILFFDLRLRGFTFMHHVEHTLQGELDFSLYDERMFQVPVVAATGERLVVPTRAFSAEAASRRLVGVPARRMLKLPMTARKRLGNTSVFLVSARDVLREGRRAFLDGQMFAS
jgi:aminoglycoside 3-N-acetyltransferase